jgi:DNA polymerase-3 subunit delta
VPAVSPDTVRTQVQQGTLQPVYLLVGDDDRLLDALVAAIADTVEEDLRAFNCERIYTTDKDVTADAVIEAARILPMMAARRVVTVLRAEKWLKPKRRAVEAPEADESPRDADGDPIEKGSLGPILEYLKDPVPSTVLVFVASDVNKALAPVKALYKTAAVVECWGLGARDAQGGGILRQPLALIRETVAASGRQIEPAAAQLLAERSAGDIAKLRADLDHAMLFARGERAVTRGDVEAVVSDRETVQDPWAMVNAIERGQPAVALRLLALALEDGAVPYMVLGQLAYFVREKLPRLRPEAVPAAVQAVFRTDVDLKTSAGEPRVLLERLVLELCGRRRGRNR